MVRALDKADAMLTLSGAIYHLPFFGISGIFHTLPTYNARVESDPRNFRQQERKTVV